MAKMLRTAAMVVGAVALVATGVGAVIGGAVAAGSTIAGSATFLGVAGTSWAAIGTFAALGSGVLSVTASLAQPGFTQQGAATTFQTNPQSGLPYAFGRTRMSGIRIFAETGNSPGYTKAEDLLFFGALLSAGGQIDAIERFAADGETVSFNLTTGLATTSTYSNDWMAQKVWTGGAQATGLSLSLNGSAAPGWTSAHRLSGITHALWALRFDTDGNKYSAGVPEPAWIGRWVKVYDPRLDSTYPGGSGPCRALDESTYVWSRNPPLHALTWALGRWQNGKRVLGIGAPLATIRFADFVTAANVCDANGWTCGGVEYSTDSKWDVFKRMLQAGGCVPSMSGAMIGCRVNAPRISVATITSAHLMDGISIAATKPRRERINSLVPRYRSESHDWEVISARPVTVPDLVTLDGGIRQRELDLPLVQLEVGQGTDGDQQAGQLCAYAIMNAREAGPIQWTTGPQYIGLKSGDCVTLDVPEEGLDEQPVIITSVSLDPSTGKFNFVAETETDDKHAFALGESAVPPPPYALTPPDIVPPTPTVDAWGLGAALDDNGMPYLTIYGDLIGTVIDSVLVQYKRTDSTDWLNAGTIIVYQEDVVFHIAGVDGGTDYEARIAYRNGDVLGPWRQLAAVTTPVSAIAAIEDEFADLAADTSAALAAIAALEGQIDDLLDSVGTLEGDVAALNTLTATQGASIADNATAISTVDANLANVTLELRASSPNLLRNGGFGDGFEYWVQKGGDVWFQADMDTAIYGQHIGLNRTDQSGGNWAISHWIYTDRPGSAGLTYTLAADIRNLTSSGLVYLDMQFLNSSNAIISSVQGAGAPAGQQFDSTGAARQAQKVTATAPVGTVKIRSVFRTANPVGGTQIAVRNVKLELGDKATGFSEETGIVTQYSVLNTLSGQYASLTDTVGVLGASVTSQSAALATVQGDVTTLFSRWSLTVDVNGYWGGAEINNNGTTIGMKLRSDLLEISKPGGGERFEYSNGNIRIYDAANVLRVQLGVNF